MGGFGSGRGSTRGYQGGSSGGFGGSQGRGGSSSGGFGGGSRGGSGSGGFGMAGRPSQPSGPGSGGFGGSGGSPSPSGGRGGGAGPIVGAVALVAVLALVGFLVFGGVLGGRSNESLDAGQDAVEPATEQAVAAGTDQEAPEEQTHEDGLAYAALTEGQQQVYLQLLQGVTSLAEKIEVQDANKDDIEPSFNALMTDHPELFWVDGSTHYSYYEDGGPITVEPGTTVALDQVPALQAQIEAEADAFIATVPADADEYTKARMAYEYIIDICDYVTGASQNQNIQSVFLNHASVCAGYSRSYQYLLQRMGMFCSYVEGTIPSRGETHAWNLVRIDGTYTYVDVTWGDPAYPGTEDDQTGVSYDYLCLTTAEILADDHVFDDESLWPECTSGAYDYYGLSGRLFYGYDTQALSASFWDQVNQGITPVAFKFADETSYVAARDSLASGGLFSDDIHDLFEQRDMSGSQYSYQYVDGLHILKLFL